jgi:hypothetical protein
MLTCTVTGKRPTYSESFVKYRSTLSFFLYWKLFAVGFSSGLEYVNNLIMYADLLISANCEKVHTKK